MRLLHQCSTSFLEHNIILLGLVWSVCNGFKSPSMCHNSQSKEFNFMFDPSHDFYNFDKGHFWSRVKLLFDLVTQWYSCFIFETVCTEARELETVNTFCQKIGICTLHIGDCDLNLINGSKETCIVVNNVKSDAICQTNTCAIVKRRSRCAIVQLSKQLGRQFISTGGASLGADNLLQKRPNFEMWVKQWDSLGPRVVFEVNLVANLSRQEEFYLLNCISQIFQIFIPSGSTDLVREHVTVTGGFYESTNLCICTALPLHRKKTFIRNIDLNFQGNLSNMQICWMKIFADWKRMPSSQF